LVSAFLTACVATLIATHSAASFKIDVNGLLSGQQLTPVNAIPGETLSLATYGEPVIAAFGTTTDGKSIEIEQHSHDSWRVTAPAKPGLYPFHLSAADGTTKSVQLLVGEPYNGQKSQSGYRIGSYPDPGRAPKAGVYDYPDGFIELHKHNLNESVSDHFTLGQFMCKQSAGWPRYIVLQPSLIVMLENIVALLQRKGVPANTLSVLSGYRTPSYNAGLDNVPYSRHIYGDAADIYVDSDGDSFMDDLNNDGVVSIKDAQLLANLIATLPNAHLSGIGVYPATSAHGPFVHVDTRGYKARWGAWD